MGLIVTTEKIEVIFILDGGPLGKSCCITGCVDPSVGTFLILDNNDKDMGTVQFCGNHAKQFATGWI